jgi:excisionase family DNA binding protein
MATSPVPSVPPQLSSSDVFEKLARCQHLLTAKEVAQPLSISPKTVYAYVERNSIPHYKIEASVRFRRKDVADCLRDAA